MGTSNVWLTEITLTNRSRALISDSASIHRWLTLAADGPGFLWVSPRPRILIIQSHRPLRREALARGVETMYTAERNLQFPGGARLELTGIVAPTKAEPRPEKRGKIVPLPAEDTPAWVTRKLSPCLQLDAALTIERMSPSKGKKLDGTPLLHPRTSFHTYGTVTDPDALADLLKTGVGRGKRFGAGLILVKETA